MEKKRRVGRPRIDSTWTARVRDLLKLQPGMRTSEILRRLRLLGCPAGKTALYQLVALCRLGNPKD